MKLNDKFAPIGKLNNDGVMVPFKLLVDKISKIAMNRISADGRPSIWFSELCTILGLPQPVIDRMIYFDMDPSMFRSVMLDFEKRNEATIEIFSTSLFTVSTKDAVYYMEYKDGKWSIRVKAEGFTTVSKEFLNEIETLCKLVGSWFE